MSGKEMSAMAFDAGMLACTLAEIRSVALGARVERVFQPSKDEIILQTRSVLGGKRLLINAGSSSPRIGFTETPRENPSSPPMLCMLLRKHLQGAKLAEVLQAGFERVAILVFESRDEMGFPTVRKLYCEIMGKYSNLVFTDGNDKILSVLTPVDFSTSSRRQVLPGMTYELPPAQEKTDPLTVDADRFAALLAAASPDDRADKWILSTFLGVSAAVAREVVFRASGKVDVPLRACDPVVLSARFLSVIDDIRTSRWSPCLVSDGSKPIEYAFLPLTQYTGYTLRSFDSAGALLDAFFGSRDREQAIRQHASDILHILTSADARIRKKLSLQRAELADCDKGAACKKQADMITANLHLLSRGQSRAELTDYEDVRPDGTFGTCPVELDPRLTPAANAQRLYKKYNKSKTARVELSRQIALGEAELAYLDTVFDSLTHAETSADLSEIREELFRSGYASRMKHYVAPRKQSAPAVAEFRTSGGYRVLCGKNNVQNEYITHRLAGKNDYWFHIKNLPGSHAVLITSGTEPSPRDFTDAAEIAAFFSKGSDGQNVEVDYTLVRNVRKPAGTKPGFVIYHTNWSCIVSPDPEKIARMRLTKGPF